jgi:hypothetical protein
MRQTRGAEKKQLGAGTLAKLLRCKILQQGNCFFQHCFKRFGTILGELEPQGHAEMNRGPT